MPMPPPCRISPKAARRARRRQPVTISASAAAAVPASRTSIGSALRSTAYFSRKDTPTNSTSTPALATTLPVVA